MIFSDMRDIYTDLQMEGVEPIDQAKRAIAHVLNAIESDERKWDLMGLGTQSYALLTEAAATLWNRRVEDVRRNFIPKKLLTHAERGDGE